MPVVGCQCDRVVATFYNSVFSFALSCSVIQSINNWRLTAVTRILLTTHGVYSIFQTSTKTDMSSHILLILIFLIFLFLFIVSFSSVLFIYLFLLFTLTQTLILSWYGKLLTNSCLFTHPADMAAWQI